MSRTTALGVAPDRAPVKLLELHNSYGWAPSIWGRLVGNDSYWRDGKILDRLWASIETLPDWQQVPLVLTFDTGVIPFQAYEWAAAQLAQFDKERPAPEGHVNHVPAVAELLRTGFEAPFFGVWGTSVSENPFNPWNEEADEPGTGIPLKRTYVLGQHWPIVFGREAPVGV